ncbi:MAG: hypothetical protein RMJ35_13250, partial [Phycisphaerales bacterium]|nr:hypothetical protein [Phycisphaerales bacterium]
GSAWLLVVLSFVSVVGQFCFERKEDWQAVHRHLSALPSEPRLLVFVGNDGEIALEYYERRRGRIAADRTGLPAPFYAAKPPRAMQRIGSVEDLAPLRSVEGYSSIILIGTHMSWSDPAGLALAYLLENYRSIARHGFNGVHVEHFKPKELP